MLFLKICFLVATEGFLRMFVGLKLKEVSGHAVSCNLFLQSQWGEYNFLNPYEFSLARCVLMDYVCQRNIDLNPIWKHEPILITDGWLIEVPIVEYNDILFITGQDFILYKTQTNSCLYSLLLWKPTKLKDFDVWSFCVFLCFLSISHLMLSGSLWYERTLNPRFMFSLCPFQKRFHSGQAALSNLMAGHLELWQVHLIENSTV